MDQASLSPYLALLQVGFDHRRVTTGGRELLPHVFNLILFKGRYGFCVTLRIPISLAIETLGVTQHLARWSPDFPPRQKPGRSPSPPDTSILTLARLFQQHQRWPGSLTNLLPLLTMVV